MDGGEGRLSPAKSATELEQRPSRTLMSALEELDLENLQVIQGNFRSLALLLVTTSYFTYIMYETYRNVS